ALGFNPDPGPDGNGGGGSDAEAESDETPAADFKTAAAEADKTISAARTKIRRKIKSIDILLSQIELAHRRFENLEYGDEKVRQLAVECAKQIVLPKFQKACCDANLWLAAKKSPVQNTDDFFRWKRACDERRAALFRADVAQLQLRIAAEALRVERAWLETLEKNIEFAQKSLTQVCRAAKSVKKQPCASPEFSFWQSILRRGQNDFWRRLCLRLNLDENDAEFLKKLELQCAKGVAVA
ncbi:MAG: hypothetical protein NZ534_02715, partial [Bacteroidia bacterium]|nr:hypothetical protein [Bacteroidia bacterium]